MYQELLVQACYNTVCTVVLYNTICSALTVQYADTLFMRTDGHTDIIVDRRLRRALGLRSVLRIADLANCIDF